MAELLVLAAGLVAAGAIVLVPLWRPTRSAPDRAEADAAAARHRAALDALRDVEADRNAGSLDDPGYASQRAEAEARAASTRAALVETSEAPPSPTRGSRGRAIALLGAGLIGLALVGGSAAGVAGLANATVVNEALAAANAAEAARQARIEEIVGALSGGPEDAELLSDLADEHLAGATAEDLVRAAVTLQLLITYEPDRADAYERLLTAYIRAADYPDARAVLDSYAAIESADPVELAFFGGLIALRGEDDPARALEAFDTFLELAPDDARAPMIRGLRDEAAEATGP